MVDYSFIRLSTTLQKALDIGDSPVANIIYSDTIQLLPNEVYLQITNTENGIAFNGNYQVLVIDLCENQLADITNNVAIEQFTDNNGLPQIKFELAYLGVDFYKKPVIIKFIHTVSNLEWYSNPLTITAYNSEYTTRFDYRGYKDFYGTAYNTANCFQSIRLNCFFDVDDAESKSSEYISIDGKKVTSRLIQTDYKKYKFDECDNFTYQRLNKVLTSSVIYVNGLRMTDKVVIGAAERIADSNFFKLDFRCATDYNETFTPSLQIFQNIDLISKVPTGSFSTLVPTEIVGQFNQSITLGSGNIYLYKDNVLFATFGIGDLVTTSDTFTIDILGLITANGVYSIQIDSGLFISSFGLPYVGINNNTDWTFSVVDADYASADYSNDYLI